MARAVVAALSVSVLTEPSTLMKRPPAVLFTTPLPMEATMTAERIGPEMTGMGKV
jgi:hypothetical protein